MLRALDPVLREMAHMGAWNVISPVEASGTTVGGCPEPEGYSDQGVLDAHRAGVGRVGGEEDIPPGVVAVITPDMPDVLSHVSVRARNEGCLFATVFDAGKMTEMEWLARPGCEVFAVPAAEMTSDRGFGGRRGEFGRRPTLARPRAA